LKRFFSSFSGGFIILFCPFFADKIAAKNLEKALALILAVIAVYFGCGLLFNDSKLKVRDFVSAAAGMIFALFMLSFFQCLEEYIWKII